MKQITASIMAAAAALFLVALTTPAFADDKVETITGDAKCAKCSLHETAKCQTVIQAQKDGKTVTYYLAKNDTSKAFHQDVCTESKKVTATGTVKEVDGKMQLTISKIDLVK